MRDGLVEAARKRIQAGRRTLRIAMGQARRTTKLLLDLSKRDKGGANSSKRAFLDRTAQVLNDGRTFSIDFFLAHAEKFQETVLFYSQKHLEMRERPISSHELLSLSLRQPPAQPQSTLTPGRDGTLASVFPPCRLSIAAR